MLAVDAAAIGAARRYKGLVSWCVVMGCAGMAALVLGGLIAGCTGNYFGIYRLWAYGVFVHGAVLLAATAVLWRQTRPVLAGGAAACMIIMSLIAVDAFLIEPHWLEVSYWRISSSKIDRPIRIVIVADLQTDQIGPYERAVLRRALQEKPDLILMAGDYVQTLCAKHDRIGRELNEFLAEIGFTAPLGVFAVRGNVDPYGWQKLFDGLDITTVNAKKSFDLGDLRLTCLGLSESFSTTLTVANPDSDRFHLVLGHAPNFAMGAVDADLLVAGHTHGGQVRFPWVGAIVTHSRIPSAWAAGLTDLPDGGRLLVSRGIGMERGRAPPMRFLCRPELMIVDLTPEEQETTDAHR